MAAIAESTSAPTGLSSEQLQERFVQFAAATKSAGFEDEIHRMYNSITSDPAGTEWLRGLLSDENLKQTTSSVENLSSALLYDEKAPTEVTFVFIGNSCNIQIVIKGKVNKVGHAVFNRTTETGVSISTGNTGCTNLSTATSVRVNANRTTTQIEFRKDGNKAGSFMGKGIDANLSGEVEIVWTS